MNKFLDNIRLCGYITFMKNTAQLFKALSDETRLRILGLLLEGELCVCDLVAVLELPQSTVSRHLAYLRNSGLVSDSRHGVWMHYRLPDSESAMRQDLLSALRKNLKRQPQFQDDQDRLQKYMLKKQEAACG